ncbi:hypothetical protein LIN78_07005 [Leeia sp. TBRC 13508]|uniref:Zinc ribbon domain-containing protein n=1 Tax=Leeia speluncae TaxID=2884804 RepID=A0ABS8D522_9NEIS|nr:hypothetical protein [Leeia speluncae]MCB6183290.1 hypothetical protein [Leeia speluncae]
MHIDSHGFVVCPKCKANARTAEGKPIPICPSCGVVFAKILASSPMSKQAHDEEQDDDTSTNPTWKERFITPPASDDTISDHDMWWVRAIGLGLLVWWSLHFITMNWHTNEIGSSFMHNINLVFHEAGHLFFRPFGRLIMFFGGSFFQVLWPLILAAAFLLKYKNPFAASVCFAWAGQSLMDVAPYIGDARSLQLGLIGEYNEDIVDMRSERHDWHNILGDLGLLEKDQLIANLAHNGGRLMLIIACVWAAAIVYAQYQSQRSEKLED